MAWCPSCKNEFVDGIKVCPKCEVKLFKIKENALNFDFEANGENIDLYDEDGVLSSEKKSSSPGNEGENTADTFDNDSFYAALDHAFGGSGADEKLKPEELNELEIIKNRTVSSEEHAKLAGYGRRPSTYQNAGEKASEMKASAASLIIVGVCGLVFMVLLFLEIIPIRLNTFSHYTIPLVMGVLFLILIIAGILSIKSFRHLKKDASTEDKLESEIKEWYTSSLTAEIIDENLFMDDKDDPEEEKYFKRYAKINAMLKAKFMNLDPLFSDHIVEDIYHYLYESEA